MATPRHRTKASTETTADSTPDIATGTTAETAQHATRAAAIDLSQTNVLGLFSGGDDPRALLRAADGTTIMARPDDVTPLGTVTAITQTYVLLNERGTLHRLTVPG